MALTLTQFCQLYQYAPENSYHLNTLNALHTLFDKNFEPLSKQSIDYFQEFKSQKQLYNSLLDDKDKTDKFNQVIAKNYLVKTLISEHLENKEIIILLNRMLIKIVNSNFQEKQRKVLASHLSSERPLSLPQRNKQKRISFDKKKVILASSLSPEKTTLATNRQISPFSLTTKKYNDYMIYLPGLKTSQHQSFDNFLKKNDASGEIGKFYKVNVVKDQISPLNRGGYFAKFEQNSFPIGSASNKQQCQKQEQQNKNSRDEIKLRKSPNSIKPQDKVQPYVTTKKISKEISKIQMSDKVNQKLEKTNQRNNFIGEKKKQSSNEQSLISSKQKQKSVEKYLDQQRETERLMKLQKKQKEEQILFDKQRLVQTSKEKEVLKVLKLDESNHNKQEVQKQDKILLQKQPITPKQLKQNFEKINDLKIKSQGFQEQEEEILFENQQNFMKQQISSNQTNLKIQEDKKMEIQKDEEQLGNQKIQEKEVIILDEFQGVPMENEKKLIQQKDQEIKQTEQTQNQDNDEKPKTLTQQNQQKQIESSEDKEIFENKNEVERNNSELQDMYYEDQIKVNQLTQSDIFQQTTQQEQFEKANDQTILTKNDFTENTLINTNTQKKELLPIIEEEEENQNQNFDQNTNEVHKPTIVFLNNDKQILNTTENAYQEINTQYSQPREVEKLVTINTTIQNENQQKQVNTNLEASNLDYHQLNKEAIVATEKKIIDKQNLIEDDKVQVQTNKNEIIGEESKKAQQQNICDIKLPVLQNKLNTSSKIKNLQAVHAKLGLIFGERQPQKEVKDKEFTETNSEFEALQFNRSTVMRKRKITVQNFKQEQEEEEEPRARQRSIFQEFK